MPMTCNVYHMPLSKHMIEDSLVRNLDVKVEQMRLQAEMLLDMARHNPALFERYDAECAEIAQMLNAATFLKYTRGV